MSDFMRDLEHAQHELKSVTSETRMSSWVLGLLPLLAGGFMMLTNPDFFQPMFHEPLGHKLLLIALSLEAVGAFLLYRLAKSL
jgi:tight adherence protein B